MEKLQLWYCDNVATSSWQFYLLAVPMLGAWLYGQEKKKIAWTLIGVWMSFQIVVSGLTNLLFVCQLPD